MLDAVTRLIELGGPVVLVLLTLSVIGAAVIVFKSFQLTGYSNRVFNKLTQNLHAGELKEAHGNLGELVQFAYLQEKSEDAEEEITRRANELMRGLHNNLRLVELIAYLSPLLGLLGTVLGMIDAFRGLEVDVNQADAGVLAGGIWEALLTTAVGLGIAIPMTAAHALLEGWVIRIGERLQDLLGKALSSA